MRSAPRPPGTSFQPVEDPIANFLWPPQDNVERDALGSANTHLACLIFTRGRQ